MLTGHKYFTHRLIHDGSLPRLCSFSRAGLLAALLAGLLLLALYRILPPVRVEAGTLAPQQPASCTTPTFDMKLGLRQMELVPLVVATADFNGDGNMDMATLGIGDMSAVHLYFGNGAGTFTPPIKYNVGGSLGSNPTVMIARDFTGDGKPDVVVANNNAQQITVLTNTGNGGFGLGISFSVANLRVGGMEAGDFNGDGRLDLFLWGTNTLVLLNNGTGGFGQPIPLYNFGSGQGIGGYVVEDFNGDGKPDISLSTYNGHQVLLFTANTSGGFNTAQTYAAGFRPSNMAKGDFNGDGKVDVAVINYDSANVSIFLNNGSGGFNAKADYAVGSDPVDLVTGDFSGDGKPDLAVAYDVFSRVDKIAVLTNSGTGAFTVTKRYTPSAITPSTVSRLAVRDVNNDGKPDLTMYRLDYGLGAAYSFSVMLGNGAGELGSPNDFSVGTAPWSLASDDFNGDNRPDFLVPSGFSDDLTILLSDPQTLLKSSANTYGVGDYPSSIAAGDLNGDGRHDLVMNCSSNTSAAAGGTVLIANDTGRFNTPRMFGGGDTTRVALADLNGDGRLDLASTRNAQGQVTIRLNNGSGVFDPPYHVNVSGRLHSLAAGDFNSDGKADLAVVNLDGAVVVLLGNGTGSFQSANSFPVAGEARFVIVDDWNNDGKQDLAAANSILLGNGNGGFGAAINFNGAANSIAAGDFNRDGKRDLAVINDSSTISIFMGDGAGNFAARESVALAGSPRALVAADFNGDNNVDLAVANGYGSFSASSRISIIPRLGNNTWGAPNHIPIAFHPGAIEALAVGDFNGDGKPDLAVPNFGRSKLDILLNACSGTAPNAAPTITAAAVVTRQQGSAAGLATLATVSDAETAPGSLSVTATTVPTGLTVTNLANTNGTISAQVAAGCNAAAGANTIVLTVSDGALTATANLTVNVTANTAPNLGAYPDASSNAAAGNATVTPNTPPSDNGTISALTAAAPGFTGAFSVNPVTGVVTISNANPPGRYTVTVEATDNCGLKTSRTFTLTVTGALASVSAASYRGEALAAEQIVAAFGLRLATQTLAARTLPLPTELAGTTVKVKDGAGTERLAPLFFVSGGQVNYIVPTGTANGAATVTITSGDGTASLGTVQIAAVAPGVFTANTTGRGLPSAQVLRVRANNTQSYEPVARLVTPPNTYEAVPIDFGTSNDQLFLILYGTGFRARTSLTAATATIGGVNAPVSFAGAQGGLVGVDQANVQIPRSLIGRGEVDVVLTVEGKAANTVQINVK